MANHRRTSSEDFRALSRHDTYYINGGDLFFLAGHINFRVHRYFFDRESPWFQRQLQVPASPGASPAGATEGTAIILKEPPEDFAKFLWVFYNPRYSLYNTSVDDWKVILRLAHQWQFNEVKNLVVRELEKLNFEDVDRIATYQNHGIDKNYLISRYAALCEREQPLTLSEGMQLGMETTLMIARAREYARANPSADGARSPTSAGIREDEMNTLVRQLFDIPNVTPANGEAKVNGDAGAGASNPSGGSAPPPPQKPVLVIPTDTPAAKPTAIPTAKPTDTPTGKTLNNHQEKVEKGAPAKGPQQGKGGKGKKGKGPTTPLVTNTTTTAVPELPLAQNTTEVEVEPKAKISDHKPLIDLSDPSSTLGSGSQEAKDGVQEVKDGAKDVVDGVDSAVGNAKLDEPVQNGDAEKTGDQVNTEEPGKTDGTGLNGVADETTKVEGVSDSSDVKVNGGAGDS